MRFPTMALTVAALLLVTAPETRAAPLQDAKVTVQVNDNTTRTSWYTQPIWLAVGGVALVLIILIAVLAGRSGRGNTTVVK